MSTPELQRFASLVDDHVIASARPAQGRPNELSNEEQTVTRMNARADSVADIGAQVTGELAKKWIQLDVQDLRTLRDPQTHTDALDAMSRSRDASKAYREQLQEQYPRVHRDVDAYESQMNRLIASKEARKARDAESMGLPARGDAGPVIRPADNIAKATEYSVSEEDRARREHADLSRRVNSAAQAERTSFDDPSYRESMAAQGAAELRRGFAERQSEARSDATTQDEGLEQRELDRVARVARAASSLAGEAGRARDQARLEAFEKMQRSSALERYPELRAAYELRDASDEFRRQKIRDPEASKQFQKMTEDYIRQKLVRGEKVPEVKGRLEEQERERAKEQNRNRTLESQRQSDAHLDR